MRAPERGAGAPHNDYLVEVREGFKNPAHTIRRNSSETAVLRCFRRLRR